MMWKINVPSNCELDGRGRGQCWGCPVIKCPSMQIPFKNKLETERVIFTAIARIRLGDFPKIDAELKDIFTDDLKSRIGADGDYENDYAIAALIRETLFRGLGEFRLIQAYDAYSSGYATLREAAKFAGVKVKVFNEWITNKRQFFFQSGSETGTKKGEQI